MAHAIGQQVTVDVYDSRLARLIQVTGVIEQIRAAEDRAYRIDVRPTDGHYYAGCAPECVHVA